jgi:uncharacterized YigZ family protein
MDGEKARYFEPAGEGAVELVVKKSRFLGTARRVLSPDEVKEWVRSERDRHPAARHVVHAFLIGPPNSEIAGMHDDGEPKGTAGRPVLEAIRGSELRNVLVLVTRYFGGTKLGTGGLVHAYSDCARAALQHTPRRIVRLEQAVQIRFPYAFYDSFLKLAAELECRIVSEQFREAVEVEMLVPEEQLGLFRIRLNDLCRGNCSIHLL